MDFHSLYYFKVVAKYENMSKASEELHITQPALSKSIAQLEDNLGVTLFDRNGRSIKLNKYGKFFLERAEIILKEFEKAKEDLLNLVSPGNGVVSIGFMHTLGLEIIPALMTDVKKIYPNMQFQLTQSNSSSLMSKLENGELDLCLISEFNTNQDICWEMLWEEELFLIVPKNHRLSQFQKVKVKDFADEPFITIKKGNALRQSIDHLFQKEGFQFNVAFEGEEVHTLVGLVESGLGVTLIPHIKGLEQYDIHILQVDTTECKRKIGLAYMKDHFQSPVVKQFAEFVRGYSSSR